MIKKEYLWGEICFFIFFFLLSGPLSALEYHFYEGRGNTSQISNQITAFLLYGLSDLIPYGLFYILSVKGLLFDKKYGWFGFSILIFLIVLNWSKSATYWLFANLTIFPEFISKESAEYLRSPTPLHFSVVYVLRDLLALVALGLLIRSLEQDKSMSDLMRIQAETKLGELKAQLQPHYFFNTLNSIYALSVKNSPLTPELIAGHSEVMRYILYESNKNRVKLIDDVRFIEAIVAIEKIRTGPGKEIRFETQGIDQETLIEPLLMFPFVENAFKHGGQSDTNSSYIKIVICILEKELIFEVRNDCGVQPDSDKLAGIGLKNIRQRLKLLYPNKHKLKIAEEKSEFRVFLSLQLTK